MKTYSKKKEGQKLGFRTPDHFKGQVFRGIKPTPGKFSPTQFKVQHKG